MVFPGECNVGKVDPIRCDDCSILMEQQVLRSAAGYYIGMACNCGPHCRDSGYYKNRDDAQIDLDENTASWRLQ